MYFANPLSGFITPTLMSPRLSHRFKLFGMALLLSVAVIIWVVSLIPAHLIQQSSTLAPNTGTSYGSTQPDVAATKLENDIYPAWLKTVQTTAPADYNFTVGLDSATYQATNTTQNLRLNFTSKGQVQIAYGSGAESSLNPSKLDLRLTSYGYGDNLIATSDAVQTLIKSNRLEYQRKDGLTEWYINTTAGIEQGFTLADRPTNSKETSGQSLVLTLDFSGDFRPSLAGNDSLLLQPRSTEGISLSSLRYDHLYVTDANGHVLPAHLELASSQPEDTILVRLVIDERAATYPIIIDPLIQEATLTASDAALGFGEGLKISGDGTTALIGDPYNANNGITGGAVYVFTRTKTTGWTIQSELTASDPITYFHFGNSISLSDNGNTAIVGNFDGDQNRTCPCQGAA